MKAVLNRISDCGKQTLGNLSLYNSSGSLVYECKTLELPWKNNMRQISCIPKGEYKVVVRVSQKYQKRYHILSVPNRTLILIHHGNYYTQTLGCVLVGKAHVDINSDGLKDVTSSKITMSDLLRYAPNGFNLIVK